MTTRFWCYLWLENSSVYNFTIKRTIFAVTTFQLLKTSARHHKRYHLIFIKAKLLFPASENLNNSAFLKLRLH